MATGKKTGGRRKGTPNRRTAELRAEMAASGEMPLDFLLSTMRNPAENPSVRFQAAKAACPYTSPQLQAIAVRNLGADGKPIAPVVNLTVLSPPAPAPRVTARGPDDGDTVQ